MLLIA